MSAQTARRKAVKSKIFDSADMCLDQHVTSDVSRLGFFLTRDLSLLASVRHRQQPPPALRRPLHQQVLGLGQLPPLA